MPLSLGQVSIRGFVMGAGTPYKFLTDFNPWKREAQVTVEQAMPYSDGSWAGAEFVAAPVIPLRLMIVTPTLAEWDVARRELTHALRPIGVSDTEIELRWNITGVEYVMYGRPRLVDPDVSINKAGKGYVSAAFTALDPYVYSGELHSSGTITVAQTSGGLTLPFTVPFSIDTVYTGGSATIHTDGLMDASLRLVFTGPLTEPRVIIDRADGVRLTLIVNRDIPADWSLTVDGRTKTVYLMDTEGTRYNVQDAVSGDWPSISNGDNVISLKAHPDDTGTLEVFWQDTWIG
jgi:hypothetical protein